MAVIRSPLRRSSTGRAAVHEADITDIAHQAPAPALIAGAAVGVKVLPGWLLRLVLAAWLLTKLKNDVSGGANASDDVGIPTLTFHIDHLTDL